MEDFEKNLCLKKRSFAQWVEFPAKKGIFIFPGVLSFLGKKKPGLS